MRALEQANRIRLARAELKRRIAKGDVAVADVLLDPSDEIAGMELYELLTSQKRWGTTRCAKFMDSIGLNETKTIRSLTERQRSAMAAVLQRWTPSTRPRRIGRLPRRRLIDRLTAPGGRPPALARLGSPS